MMTKESCLRITAGLAVLLLVSCSSGKVTSTSSTATIQTGPVLPEQIIWVEPMYDQVEVPAQLDPTETYYRPTHETIVEIRPGRFQPVQYPPENASVPGGKGEIK